MLAWKAILQYGPDDREEGTSGIRPNVPPMLISVASKMILSLRQVIFLLLHLRMRIRLNGYQGMVCGHFPLFSIPGWQQLTPEKGVKRGGREICGSSIPVIRNTR